MSHEEFDRLLAPSWHEDCAPQDVEAFFKRASIVLITGTHLYLRIFTNPFAEVYVDRVPLPGLTPEENSMLTYACLPTMKKYVERTLVGVPDSHESDMKWSLDILQAIHDGKEIPATKTIQGLGLYDDKPMTWEEKPDPSSAVKPSRTAHMAMASSSEASTLPSIQAVPRMGSTAAPMGSASTCSTAVQFCGTYVDVAEQQRILGSLAAKHHGEVLDLATPPGPPAKHARFCGTEADLLESQRFFESLAKEHHGEVVDLL